MCVGWEDVMCVGWEDVMCVGWEDVMCVGWEDVMCVGWADVRCECKMWVHRTIQLTFISCKEGRIQTNDL